jgi:hypothetical protein
MKTTSISILLAGLIAVAGAANAQSTPAGGSSNVPPKAGEASTLTEGQPNAKTTNSAVSDTPIVGKDAIRQDAQGRSTAAATSSTPNKAGEASTMVQGKPNADGNAPTITKSKAERKSEKELKKAQARTERETAIMGQKGAQAGAPAGTPAVSPAGTPSVKDGGTPK